jgi:uncharacterized LabA/DUF88 family protein
MNHSYIYIDGANLYQWSKLWWGLDYGRFFKWLQDKYKPNKVYIFIWYIKWKESLYSSLSSLGYTLIFKETLEIQWKTKGNVDSELVLESLRDLYENKKTRTIIVSGDGDFACLVNFFIQKSHSITILAPHKDYLSYLLKKTNAPIILLQELKGRLQKSPQ